jgi:hypothetical protein
MAKTIKKLKLTELQRHRLRAAHRETLDVLNEIKRHSLEGNALRDMKILEMAVQNIEVLLTCN